MPKLIYKKNTMNNQDKLAKDKIKRNCIPCKRHGLKAATKKHICPYQACTCPFCVLHGKAKLIMRCQQKLWRYYKATRPADGRNKQKTCGLCRNHGFEHPKTGHKNSPYEGCKCEKCTLANNRRIIMRYQQRVNRFLGDSGEQPLTGMLPGSIDSIDPKLDVSAPRLFSNCKAVVPQSLYTSFWSSQYGKECVKEVEQHSKPSRSCSSSASSPSSTKTVNASLERLNHASLIPQPVRTSTAPLMNSFKDAPSHFGMDAISLLGMPSARNSIKNERNHLKDSLVGDMQKSQNSVFSTESVKRNTDSLINTQSRWQGMGEQIFMSPHKRNQFIMTPESFQYDSSLMGNIGLGMVSSSELKPIPPLIHPQMPHKTRVMAALTSQTFPTNMELDHNSFPILTHSMFQRNFLAPSSFSATQTASFTSC